MVNSYTVTQRNKPKSHVTRLRRRFNNLLLKTLLRVRNFKESDAIIIFSSPRGGSTWLMEMLAKLTCSCINWEPLHRKKGVVPPEYQFDQRPYLPQTEKDPKYLELFSQIHAFQVHSIWTRKYLTVRKILTCKYALTKYVRANLLVPYLLSNYSFRFKPIFLLRHPIDSCLSEIRAFQLKNRLRSKKKIPDSIYNERYIRHNEFVSRLETELEATIAYWCINNCPTIEKLDKLDVLVVFYSDLLMEPDKELRRIMNAYQLPYSDKHIDRIEARKISSTGQKRHFQKDPEIQLSKNFTELSDEMKDRIQAIFDYFGFKLYNAYSPFPQKGELKRLN